MTASLNWGWPLGVFTLEQLPFVRAYNNPSTSELIGAGAASLVVLGGLAVMVILTWFGWWRPLWRNWLTSTDHKRIGIMYIVLSLVMLSRGVVEGALMRTQQATGVNGGFLTPDHFSQ